MSIVIQGDLVQHTHKAKNNNVAVLSEISSGVASFSKLNCSFERQSSM